MKYDLKEIPNLYDSHVHWLMTGEKKSYLDLQPFQKLTQISNDLLSTKNFRGEWLFGFGWNDSQMSLSVPSDEFNHLQLKGPACFIKKDAHSCLLNLLALKKVLPILESQSTLAGFIERDQKGIPTGILKESAFYAIYPLFPELTAEEIRKYLLQAQDYFLSKGFKRIRDMTCSIKQWGVLKKISENNELVLSADINFNVETLSHAQKSILPFVLKEKSFNSDHLKIRGLKFFADGSLGSQSAWLSENYKNTNSNGSSLWAENDIYELMKLCWQNDLEVSVHTLGDKAVDVVVDIARRLYSEKIRGYLNLEHVELVKPETIVKMKSLYVRCHMQPSHWLSDKSFVFDRLNGNSIKYLFAWEALRKAKVPISFGSDSPIEEADVELTIQAIEDSKNFGIESLNANYLDFYKFESR